MATQVNPRRLELLRSFAQKASVTVILAGSLALIGWSFNIAALKSVLPGLAMMKANTALAFIMAGVSLWLLGSEVTLIKRRLAKACTIFVTGLALLTLSQDLFGWNFGIDQLLFQDSLAGNGTAPPGRMSPTTALNFILVGSALLLLEVKRKAVWLAAQLLGLLAGIVALLALVGYAYDVPPLYHINPFSSMALHTAFSFILLSLAILQTRPDQGIMRLINQETASGLMLRRLLPAAIVAPFVIGWARLQGQQAGLYGTEVGLALFALSNMVIFTGLIWWNARLLHRMEIQRLQTEQALRLSEERFAKAFQASPDSIVLTRASNGQITEVNDRWCSLFGYSRAEALGRTTLELNIFADPADRQLLLNELQTHGFIRDLELPLRRKTGEIYLMSNSSEKLLVSDELYILSISRDITQRRQMEEALAEERALLARRVEERTMELSLANAELARTARLKDEFLANMSHELRTPLNAILSLSEIMLEHIFGPLTERQTQSVQTIEESGRHLLALINDILDLSKIEAGKLELDFDQVPVEPLCQTSLQFIRQIALKKRINVSFTLDNSEAILWADARRLKQVLVNLLTNAVKFTPEKGQVGLEVTGEPKQEVIHFAVWDTGIGMTPEGITRLFKPFVQLDSSLSRQQEGTGLGLTMVSRLVELHNGSIAIKSKPGQGSRFTISLPWSNIARPVEEPQPAITIPEHLTFSRALVIEDSPTAAEQLVRYLYQLGIEQVTTYPRGEGAIDTVLKTQAEVILLDIQLSILSGWEVLNQIKNNPQTAEIPVIIVSVIDERQQGLALGAADYLVKPISRAQLRTALFRLAQPPALDHGLQPAPKTTKPSILVADDNEANIQVVAEYLSDKNYHVIVARNGIEAIERAKETGPALILMDIQMPEMDGLEATRRLRADPRLARTPIIALTALAMSGDRERCLAAGANEYMSKPVSLKNLVKLIETHLNQPQEE